MTIFLTQTGSRCFSFFFYLMVVFSFCCKIMFDCNQNILSRQAWMTYFVSRLWLSCHRLTNDLQCLSTTWRCNKPAKSILPLSYSAFFLSEHSAFSKKGCFIWSKILAILFWLYGNWETRWELYDVHELTKHKIDHFFFRRRKAYKVHKRMRSTDSLCCVRGWI